MKSFAKTIIVALSIFLFVSPALSAQGSKIVSYRAYGAVGDGVADDFDAIIKAHDEANKAGLKVRADAGATYYIGGANKTVQIQTDTDWSGAKFIIDDTKVENRNKNVFNVSSKLSSARITTVKTLKKNQEKLDLSLPSDSFIVVTDNTTIRYKRSGRDQNNGAPQTDTFIVDTKGNIDKEAPIIWDFDNITSMTAYPIDAETLTITGGHFTTIAGQTNLRTYYSRGISIARSNVVVDGIVHAVTGEGEHLPSYAGFIAVSNCAGVTVQNSHFSGRKYPGMGTYDLTVNRAINVTFKNCKQLNDIHDRKLWGIFGSNYSKNITFDTVEFSRFDAHCGVANATIKNSVIGYVGIALIGSGVCLVENTKVCGRDFIILRGDYGSTFEGEVIIRNCEYVPLNGQQSDAVLINGSNSGQHDYGYTCYMPRKITIDGLVINDANPPNNYQGPKIFGTFNNAYKSEEYVEKFPYVITEEVEIRDLTVKSGKPYLVSGNPFMFRNVKITEK